MITHDQVIHWALSKVTQKTLDRLKPNFIWRLHGVLGWIFVQMFRATWTRWLPGPYKWLFKQKSPSSEPRVWLPWNLVYSIGYSSTTKFVQMMTLGWPWPFLWHEIKVTAYTAYSHVLIQHTLCTQMSDTRLIVFWFLSCFCFYAPNFKLRGHIGLGLSILLSVCPLRLYTVGQEPLKEKWSWNSI